MVDVLGLSLTEFISGVLSILAIDLVLAGDNAIVIGLACCKLPKKYQTKAILLGTGGAIVVRIVATVLVVWLLKIPGLMLGGGLLLVWIAYKLIAKPDDHGDVKCHSSLGAAVMTIIVADAAMGIDNVLAVAGASHGSYILVIFGLLVSIPIMVFCSTLIIKLINKFPIIIDIGAGIIAYTAGKMITEEALIHSVFVYSAVKYSFIAIVVAGVIVVGRVRRKKLEEAIAAKQETSEEKVEAVKNVVNMQIDSKSHDELEPVYIDNGCDCFEEKDA